MSDVDVNRRSMAMTMNRLREELNDEKDNHMDSKVRIQILTDLLATKTVEHQTNQDRVQELEALIARINAKKSKSISVQSSNDSNTELILEDALQRQIEDSNQVNVELTDKVFALQKENSQLSASHDRIHKRFDVLTHRLTKTALKLRDATQQIKRLKYGRPSGQFEHFIDQLSDDEDESEVITLREKVKDLEDDLDLLHERIHQMTMEKDSLTAGMGKDTEELLELNEGYKRVVIELTESCKDKDTLIQQMETLIQMQGDKIVESEKNQSVTSKKRDISIFKQYVSNN